MIFALVGSAAVILGFLRYCPEVPRNREEHHAVDGLRTLASAEIAFATEHGGKYADLDTLVAEKYCDERHVSPKGMNGYVYTSGDVLGTTHDGAPPRAYGFIATPLPSDGYFVNRFIFSMGTDEVVRFQGAASGYSLPSGTVPGDPVPRPYR
jgi:hypothetical protein